MTLIPYDELELEAQPMSSGTGKIVHQGKWKNQQVTVLTLCQVNCVPAMPFQRLVRESPTNTQLIV